MNELSKLPGVGRKSALRLALFLLKQDKEMVDNGDARYIGGNLDEVDSYDVIALAKVWCDVELYASLCALRVAHLRAIYPNVHRRQARLEVENRAT